MTHAHGQNSPHGRFLTRGVSYEKVFHADDAPHGKCLYDELPAWNVPCHIPYIRDLWVTRILRRVLDIECAPLRCNIMRHELNVVEKAAQPPQAHHPKKSSPVSSLLAPSADLSSGLPQDRSAIRFQLHSPPIIIFDLKKLFLSEPRKRFVDPFENRVSFRF